MPDITMCSGEGCKLKERCYRFTAEPSKYRQSYFAKPPCDADGEKCRHFWEVESKSQIEARRCAGGGGVMFTAEDFYCVVDKRDDCANIMPEIAAIANAKIAPLVAELAQVKRALEMGYVVKDEEITALKAKLEVCAEQIHVALAALTDGDNHWHAQNEILTATRPCTACEAKARIEALGRKA